MVLRDSTRLESSSIEGFEVPLVIDSRSKGRIKCSRGRQGVLMAFEMF